VLDVVPIRRALISVSDKTGLKELGAALARANVEVLSTGGTAKALREAGVTVKEVAEHTGFPEMLDGRVKTLHPKIHGGLLGRRDFPTHREQMAAHGIAPIDLVVVNLYPFEKIAGQADASWEELIENIDIGGPSMLRSAAKNHDAVAVACDPADYEDLIVALDVAGGTAHQLRRRLALKVFARTAAYDAAIAARLAIKAELERPEPDPVAGVGLGEVLPYVATRQASLRYGENPHQLGAVYATPRVKGELDVATAVPLQGKELSYNNLLDVDAAVYALRCLIDGQAQPGTGAVIIKHNTPCGAAWSPSTASASAHGAWRHALAGDPVSAFGGIVAVGGVIDEATAAAMADVFLEVVVAAGFDDGARAVFAKKSALRLLALPDLVTAHLPRHAVRSIPGGLLVQQHDGAPKAVRLGQVVSKRAPTDDEWRALDVAWRLCAPVKSNAITLARPDPEGGVLLIGAGGGQTSRVDSARIAVSKAREHKHVTAGSVCGSDAFFPFADGVGVLVDAGVTAIAQPGGSKRDAEVVAAADAAGMAMVMMGERHFRH
jgi:phosphoribosylaminoimidazolecarboxamide formyltransferase/IMP cyclohydrolase